MRAVLDFRRFLESGLRSSRAGSFPEQRLVIEPSSALLEIESLKIDANGKRTLKLKYLNLLRMRVFVRLEEK